MKTRKGILIGVLLTAILLLCVAGVKISRMPRTATLGSNTLFMVVKGGTGNTRTNFQIYAEDVARGLGQWITNAGSGGVGEVSTAQLIVVSNQVQASSNKFFTDVSNLQGGTNGLHAGKLNSATNGNQFLGVPLTIKDGSLQSNNTFYGNQVSFESTNTVITGAGANAIFSVINASNYFGAQVQFAGMSPGTDKVLTSVDASGNAIWRLADLPSAVTNVVSLSSSNATSKPLTNSYSGRTLRLYGLEAGANVTVTPNGSNYVVASTGGGGGGAFTTNDVAVGTQNTANYTNNTDILWILSEIGGDSRIDIEARLQADAVDFAQMQNLSAGVLIGNRTGSGVQNPEEVAPDNTSVEITSSAVLRRMALTGDVTASAGGAATTIAANAVTDAKFRQSGALSVPGRSVNSAGNIADISATVNGQILQRTNNTLTWGKIPFTNDYIANANFLTVTPGQSLVFHDSTGLVTNRGPVSEINPFIFYDDFNRPPLQVTNLGTSSSGHQWNMLSAVATDQATISNGTWRPHGANNGQIPYYASFSNTVAGREVSRMWGKIQTVYQPAGFPLTGVGAMVLSDTWPDFSSGAADQNGLHIAMYYDHISFEKWPAGTVMHRADFPADLSFLTNTIIIDVQWSSNTVWWSYGHHKGSFTHPDWYAHSKKDYAIWRGEVCTTNSILSMWDAVGAGYAEADAAPLHPVILLAGGTNLPQSVETTPRSADRHERSFYQITNASHFANIHLTNAPSNYRVIHSISNSGASDITCTIHTNSASATFYDAADKTNATSFTIRAGSLEISEFTRLGTFWVRTRKGGFEKSLVAGAGIVATSTDPSVSLAVTNVLANLAGTVGNNVTNENSSQLTITTGTITLTSGSVLDNLVGTVSRNVTNETSSALRIDSGSLALTEGSALSNLTASVINFSSDNVVSNLGGIKGLTWTNYVPSTSNFVFTCNTNFVELKNQTNIVLTNLVEEATGIRGNIEIHVHNTFGGTMGIVWPAYGPQHGYNISTNVNNPVLSTTSLAAGAHALIGIACFGTNFFPTITTWP